jgi:two-component sensor histidine kinase
MDLQIDTVETLKDPQVLQLFQQSKDRIRSMALIHENIYQSQDLAGIDGIKYTEELIDYFFSSYGDKARDITPILKLVKPLTGISLNMGTAIPLGLILTELLTNSLKHAFPAGRKGKIDITFSSESINTLTLTVSDNGVGLPPGFNSGETQTLGIKLVSLLTRQLKGTLKIMADQDKRNENAGDGCGGTAFKITFPYPVQ